MRSIGRSVRSVRSVCVKESKISVNKIFVLFVRFVFKKNSDLWFILVEHEIIVFEHEIRRRPTDRREVIKRIKRIFYCTRISRITRIFYNEILNTNSTNYTNIIFHTDLTDLCLRQFLIMGFLDL